MDTLTLPVESRETGKKAAKAVRNAGRVPCVLYGAHTEPVHFSVETLDLRPLIHTTETYRVAITVDGADHEAVVKEIVYHPVTDRPIHVDFLALTRGEAVTMTIPVHLVGTAQGVREGGTLSHAVHEVEVRALPKDLPGHLDLDVSELGVGESLHVSDLQAGNGVELLADADRTIVSVVPPQADAALDAEEAAAAESEA